MSNVDLPEVKPRSMEQIGAEYTELCKQAGDIQYRVLTMQSDLNNLNRKMSELNKEAQALSEAEKKAKEEAAQAPKAEVASEEQKA